MVDGLHGSGQDMGRPTRGWRLQPMFTTTFSMFGHVPGALSRATLSCTATRRLRPSLSRSGSELTASPPTRAVTVAVARLLWTLFDGWLDTIDFVMITATTVRLRELEHTVAGVQHNKGPVRCTVRGMRKLN